jgi:4-hydroxybenzoate polyprenyltransferase
MVYQTNSLLLHIPLSRDLVFFVFFSTMCSYNFHWYLTPFSVQTSERIQWTQRFRKLHLVLYFIGLFGSIFFFFKIIDHWMALAFGAFVTFLYSAPKLPLPFFKDLKKIAIGKTIFLSVVWMYVTAVLPILVSGVPWKTEYSFFALSRFFLIYAICIIFDYRDRDDDKRDGIRSMITYFNETGINLLFIFSILFFAGSTIALYAYNYSVYTILILLTPGLITAALYQYAKKNYSDYLYYFVLDGLMMFSGLLMLILKI